jgi:hypothetical protein
MIEDVIGRCRKIEKRDRQVEKAMTAIRAVAVASTNAA